MTVNDRQVDLDDVDKAIIRELQHDGRLPFAQLAPRVGLSEAATRQRVNRLVDRGVMQIVAVADPSAIGLDYQAMLGIKVSGDVKHVADALVALPEVDYVVIVAGRFDVLAEIVCADATTMLDVVNDRIRLIDGVADIETMIYQRLVGQKYDWGTA